MNRVIRIKHICQLTGCSPATIWRWVKTDPSFPRPFKLGPNSTGFSDLEINSWLSAKKRGEPFTPDRGTKP